MKPVVENSLTTAEEKESISVVRTRVGELLSEEAEESTISVRKFLTQPAFVEVRAGVTKNCGNYESLRLDVSVRVPCYLEEITEVEVQATKWVDDRMSDKLDEWEKRNKSV